MGMSLQGIKDQVLPPAVGASTTTCPHCGKVYDLQDEKQNDLAYDEYETVEQSKGGIPEIARHICGGLVRFVYAGGN